MIKQWYKPFFLSTGWVLLTAFCASAQSSVLNLSDSLEWKAVSKTRKKQHIFRISNKDTQYEKWVKLGQRTGDYTIQGYQPENHSLLIEKDDQIGTLELSKTQSQPLSKPNLGKEINSKDLRFRNGLYYEAGNEETPFTGRATKKYPAGKNWYDRSYKDGKKHGKTVEWFPNGQKKYEMFYDDNKRTGIWNYWDQNGKLTAKREYENNQFKRNLPLGGK